MIIQYPNFNEGCKDCEMRPDVLNEREEIEDFKKIM